MGLPVAGDRATPGNNRCIWRMKMIGNNGCLHLMQIMAKLYLDAYVQT